MDGKQSRIYELEKRRIYQEKDLKKFQEQSSKLKLNVFFYFVIQCTIIV